MGNPKNGCLAEMTSFFEDYFRGHLCFWVGGVPRCEKCPLCVRHDKPSGASLFGVVTVCPCCAVTCL